MGPSRSIPALHASGLPKAHRNMDRAQWIRHLAVFPANLETTEEDKCRYDTALFQLCPKGQAGGKKEKRKLIIRNRNTDSQSQWQFLKG